MNKRHTASIRYVTAALLLLVLVLTAACGRKQGAAFVPETLEDFNQSTVTIGTTDGYIFADVVRRELPQAQLKIYQNRSDVYKALQTGAIDGAADDEPIIRAHMRASDDFVLFDGYLEPSDYAFFFPKNERGDVLREQFNTYLENCRNSGVLDTLNEKWFGKATDNKTSEDAAALPDINGTVRIAFDDSNIPFAYFSAGKAVGYDVDLAVGFCREYGYGLEFTKTAFTDMLADVAAGKLDAGCGAITITQDRAKYGSFSDPSYTGGISICGRAAAARTTRSGFFADLRARFTRSFVDDGRGAVFAKGILTTVLMTLLAVLFGTPLGFIFFILSRRTGLVVRSLTRLVTWLIHGIPAVMLIMLLYYRYYRDLTVGGMFAAVIGFTIAFGESVYSMLKKYAPTLNGGKTERAYRLDLIDGREFYERLFYQRGAVITADFREMVVSLIKGTAVAGFIAVTDLTRAYELIRTGSYEITLPLIVTTLVYFLIIKLFSAAVGLLIRGVRIMSLKDLRRRTQEERGVQAEKPAQPEKTLQPEKTAQPEDEAEETKEAEEAEEAVSGEEEE